MNENKAFQLIKKAEKPLICKDESGYLISDGAFLFKTYNAKKLTELGLIDFTGEVKENHKFLSGLFAKASLTSNCLYDIGLRFERNKKTPYALLFCEDYVTAVDCKYLSLFNSPAEYYQESKSNPVYLKMLGDSGFKGLILPVRLIGKELETAEIIHKALKDSTLIKIK